MDVTLHNQGEVIIVPAQTMADSLTADTDISYLSDTKDSRSHKSLESYHSMKTLPSEKAQSVTSNRSKRSSTSGKGLRSDRKSKSAGSSKSLKSAPSRTTTVCSLPPIVSKDNISDAGDLENISKRSSLSSSHSGLNVVINDFGVELNGIDIEIDDDSFHLGMCFHAWVYK